VPIETVRNQIFYHINSTANASRHDLMRCGSIIDVGRESNPFFGFYETWQRSYTVKNKTTGTTDAVPPIQFLRRVKDKDITLDDPNVLPQLSLEVGRHFMMLARELVWETVRLNEFPETPSRQRCIWLTRTVEQAREWVPRMNLDPKLQPQTYWIVSLRATGKALEADGGFLAEDAELLPVWHEKAHQYWRGETSANPQPEVIFNGMVEVVDIIGA
jgi:hypothetical protein